MDEQPASSPNCPYCLSSIAVGDTTESCPECHVVYHAECWSENKGCAVYGCAKAPVPEPRQAIEVPLSYWGQENKPCPSCGQEILAAAVRCRHCGATFNSARPQNSADFQARTALDARLPEARSRVIVIFVLSVVPLTAPFGALWGLTWGRRHRDELAALPPIYPAMHRIAQITSATLTIAILVMTLLYVAVRIH